MRAQERYLWGPQRGTYANRAKKARRQAPDQDRLRGGDESEVGDDADVWARAISEPSEGEEAGRVRARLRPGCAGLPSWACGERKRDLGFG